MRFDDPTARARVLRLALVVGVVVLAALLRERAVEMLPTDYDEDNYLRAAQQYAAALRSGDWNAVASNRENLEHPPGTKLLYGVVLAGLPPAPEVPRRPLSAAPPGSLPEPHFTLARVTGAAVGVLAVAALAVFDPVAALFLAVSSWQVKYTSEVMLEAVPALTSLLAVLFYVRWRSGRLDRWLVLSGVALGLTAATKYVYCIAGVAIAVDWAAQIVRERRTATAAPTPAAEPHQSLRPVLAWSAVAVIIFLAANPYLWPDPVNRLRDSLLYHPGYATGESVRTASLPPWQPLVWLSGAVPWHPGVFLVTADALIGLLALAGLRRAWQRDRVFALWLVLGLGFLLVWPAKWGQYVLVVTAPLSVVGSDGFRQFIWEPAGRCVEATRRLRNSQRKVWTAVDARE